jgi:hypothetical protein
VQGSGFHCSGERIGREGERKRNQRIQGAFECGCLPGISLGSKSAQVAGQAAPIFTQCPNPSMVSALQQSLERGPSHGLVCFHRTNSVVPTTSPTLLSNPAFVCLCFLGCKSQHTRLYQLQNQLHWVMERKQQGNSH